MTSYSAADLLAIADAIEIQARRVRELAVDVHATIHSTSLAVANDLEQQALALRMLAEEIALARLP